MVAAKISANSGNGGEGEPGLGLAHVANPIYWLETAGEMAEWLKAAVC
jgi:hypothetical protein